ncbi:protein yippee-like At4g27745 [Malus sylvestris]|uniref:protein yippee-like At4g27745 n=1 Tax=Malus sylvestris TaxID=3752 RepID=UPI0021ACE298|nr:protein yippee-like At4g27745 [Malus sylvestris]
MAHWSVISIFDGGIGWAEVVQLLQLPKPCCPSRRCHFESLSVGPKEDRHLMTGLHTVADVSCCDCHEVLGWKYERAYEQTQKYKEGKFILEKSKIVKEDW